MPTLHGLDALSATALRRDFLFFCFAFLADGPSIDTRISMVLRGGPRQLCGVCVCLCACVSVNAHTCMSGLVCVCMCRR